MLKAVRPVMKALKLSLIFATTMIVSLVTVMVWVRKAVANPIATRTNARPAMAMATAWSAAATRIRPAVTAHAMTEEPRDAVEVLFMTAQPSSVVLIPKLPIYVISTNHAVTVNVLRLAYY
jgi:hypothetical protein